MSPANSSSAKPCTGPTPAQPPPLIIPLSGNAAEERRQLQQAARVLGSGPGRQQQQGVVLDCQGRVLGVHAGLLQLIKSLQAGMGQLTVRRACLDVTDGMEMQGRLRLKHVRMRAGPSYCMLELKGAAQLEFDHCVIELLPPGPKAKALLASEPSLLAPSGSIVVGPGCTLHAYRTVWQGLAHCLVSLGGSISLDGCWLNSANVAVPEINLIRAASAGGKLQLRGCLLEGASQRASFARGTKISRQLLVGVADGCQAVVDRCTLVWRGLPDTTDTAAAQAAPQAHTGDGHQPSPPRIRSVALVFSLGRVQLSRCELRSQQGSNCGILVAGLLLGLTGAAMATRCSFTRCSVDVGEGCSLVGSHLRVTSGSQAGLQGSQIISADGGLTSSSAHLIAFDIRHGATCKLVHSHIEGFYIGIGVKGAEGEESSLELRRCKLLRMGTAVMAFGPVSVHLAGCELQVESEGTSHVHSCIAANAEAMVTVKGGVLQAQGGNTIAVAAEGPGSDVCVTASTILAGPGAFAGVHLASHCSATLRRCTLLNTAGLTLNDQGGVGNGASSSSNSSTAGGAASSSDGGRSMQSSEPTAGAYSFKANLRLEGCEVAGFDHGLSLHLHQRARASADHCSFTCRTGVVHVEKQVTSQPPSHTPAPTLTRCHSSERTGLTARLKLKLPPGVRECDPVGSAHAALGRPPVAPQLLAGGAAGAGAGGVASVNGGQLSPAGAGSSGHQGQLAPSPAAHERTPAKCAHCGSKPSKLRLCVGCLATHYCSKGCAEAHWPAHGQQCALLGARRALGL